MLEKIPKFNFINTTVLISAIILFLLFLQSHVVAITWDEFSSTMNQSFSEYDVFSLGNIFRLFGVLLLFSLLIWFLKANWSREEKEYKQSYKHHVEKLRSKKAVTLASGEAQKRNWFRLRLDTDFEWLPSHEADQSKRKSFKQDRLVDLSGGGFCFHSKEKLNINDEINFFLNVGEKEPLYLNGIVARVRKEEQGSEVNYLIGVEFKDIKETERDKIVNWTICYQRELRLNEKEDEAWSVLHRKASEQVENDAQASGESQENESATESAVANDLSDISSTQSLPNQYFAGFLNEEEIQIFFETNKQEKLSLSGYIDTIQSENGKDFKLSMNLINVGEKERAIIINNLIKFHHSIKK